MDAVGLLPGAIVEALERGAVVVTANQRAARSLRLAFDRRNRAVGLESWRPPAILAWDAWTAGIWRGLLIEGKTTQLLLNRTQEHKVWQRILIADTELKSLRSVDSLADMAAGGLAEAVQLQRTRTVGRGLECGYSVVSAVGVGV